MPGAVYSSVKQFRVCEHCDWREQDVIPEYYSPEVMERNWSDKPTEKIISLSDFTLIDFRLFNSDER
jgi:hypothetical protein